MTFNSILVELIKAKYPEQVFGLIDPETIYREYAKIVHPDVATNKEKSKEAFQLLNSLWEQAKEKIKSNTYGDKKANKKVSDLRVVSKANQYFSLKEYKRGKFSIVYYGNYIDNDKEKQCLVKVSKSHSLNHLLLNEEDNLSIINEQTQGEPIEGFFPKIIDSFITTDSSSERRKVNVFNYEDGWFTIQDVLEKYPDGVDPKTMAWMFNRALVRIGIAHRAGVIHTAINPSHYIINPADHNGRFVDWCYSIKQNERLKAVDNDHQYLYPPEIKDKKAFPSTDIYMLASLMMMLTKDKLPEQLKTFFLALTINNPFRRPNDAFEVHGQFQDILKQLYGKREFVKFEM